MIRTVTAGSRSGRVTIPASKSRAHRLLICAALSREKTMLHCRGISRDIAATIACLREMGSETVHPIREIPSEPVTLPCGESGSTLRFLLPVAGALGLRGEFIMEGRLPERPLQPLWDVLSEKGMKLSRAGNRLCFSGKIRPGAYEIAGNISSQYISGLLFALPLLAEDSELTVTGETESAAYIAMTEEALQQAGVSIEEENHVYRIPAWGYRQAGRRLSGKTEVESDWSSAAFFLSLGALSPEGVTVSGMNPDSRQGDRQILEMLKGFGARVQDEGGEITVRAGRRHGQRIDASGIPDLVPVLAVVASVSEGETAIVHAERLRLKESDRLQTTASMLRTLGAEIRETADGLIIRGRDSLRGGRVSSFGDHRIAMSAAVAASACSEPVEIEGAECTEKSFPGFWELLQRLGKDGNQE